VKDDEELAIMRRAGALSDEIFAALAKERFTGRTERELAWWVERSFREAGAEGVSFPTVVAAGETATSPHAIPGEHAIPNGVLVTVDAGCVLDGYCSDCTRTFAVGAISDRLAELYALCLESQLAGLAAVASGVAGRDADAASRGRSRQRASGEHTAMASVTASGSRSTRAPCCARSPRTCSSLATSCRSSRGSTCRERGESGSKTSSS
jgi:Xaa-Pro aminopeptidase